jgi:hypothetical protein
MAYRLRKLATPIALGPGESLRLQARVNGTSWPSKEYATGIEADFGHLDFRGSNAPRMPRLPAPNAQPGGLAAIEYHEPAGVIGYIDTGCVNSRRKQHIYSLFAVGSFDLVSLVVHGLEFDIISVHERVTTD